MSTAETDIPASPTAMASTPLSPTTSAWGTKTSMATPPAVESAESLARQAKIMAADEVTHSSYVPCQLERHLEFMHFNDEGHMILGCSNLTGRYWIGSLWYYREPEEAPSVEKALTGVDFDNGLVDGFFVDSKNILVAGDNGGVEQVRLTFSEEDDPSTSFFYLQRIHSIQEHDDLITGIVMTADKSKVVTASYDRTIVVLEAETLKLTSKVQEAHNDLISNVASNCVDVNLIATAGHDGLVSTWDLRCIEASSTSQSCIYDDTNMKPTCVQWTPKSEHHLLVGNQGGEIQLFDVRKPKECLFKNAMESGGKQVTRLKFSNDGLTFAVCSESFPVRVLTLDDKLSSIEAKYEDKRHDDFVRDVAWHPKADNKKFYSCGWDHKVFSHSL